MRFRLGVVSVFLSLLSFSQSKHANTLLWEISGKGLKNSSYIYGTFHLMCPEDLVVAPELEKRFNTTRQLYLELDMDDPSLVQQLMVNTTMKGDTTLSDLLPKAEYDTLGARFQKYTGIPLALLNNLKPFFSLSAAFPSLLDCKATEGWEKKFMEMAKSNNEEVKGLETVKDQLDVVDSIPYSVQAKMLSSTLLNIDSTKKSLQQLIKVYKEKNIDKIQELTKEDKDFGQYDAMMIDKRNAKWVPVIIEQATAMPTFFAVGAGHLGGEKGIIQLLQNKGYTVKPVMY